MQSEIPTLLSTKIILMDFQNILTWTWKSSRPRNYTITGAAFIIVLIILNLSYVVCRSSSNPGEKKLVSAGP